MSKVDIVEVLRSRCFNSAVRSTLPCPPENPCDFCAAANEIERLREVLRRALLSMDSEWEEKNLGHDWADWCKEAREALKKEKQNEKDSRRLPKS